MKKGNLVIAFVGMPGAGKSSCVAYLEGKGYPSVYFGGITLEEVRRRGLAVNERNEKIIREGLRKTEGKTVFADRIIPKIDALFASGETRAVADGLYSWSEYKAFKEHFGDDAIIIAVISPRSVRHKRLASRDVRPLNSDEVTSREYAEIEQLEKGGPIANADYALANSKNLKALHHDLDNLLTEIKFY